MYVWMDERMYVWMYGCMDVWMYGCMDGDVHLVRYWPANQQRSIRRVTSTEIPNLRWKLRERQLLSPEYNLRQECDGKKLSSLNALSLQQKKPDDMQVCMQVPTSHIKRDLSICGFANSRSHEVGVIKHP